jgi:hypothetical protein
VVCRAGRGCAASHRSDLAKGPIPFRAAGQALGSGRTRGYQATTLIRCTRRALRLGPQPWRLRGRSCSPLCLGLAYTTLTSSGGNYHHREVSGPSWTLLALDQQPLVGAGQEGLKGVVTLVFRGPTLIKACASAARAALMWPNLSVPRLDVEGQQPAHELVPAESHDHILRTQMLLQGSDDPLQELISGGVAEGVVGRLESIHVNERHHERLPGPVRPSRPPLQLHHPSGTPRSTGQ